MGAVRDGLHQMSDIEQLIVQRTGCYDLAKVQEILELCNGDIEATVDNVIASLNMMANESKQQIAKALEEQKQAEQKSKKNRKKNKKKNKAKCESVKVRDDNEKKENNANEKIRVCD